MSGIAAISNLDGSACDALLLGRMAKSMQHRGRHIASCICSEVGLVEARWNQFPLRQENQMGQYSLVNCVADARLSNRQDLCSSLIESHKASTESGFILAAYKVWGRECVHRLLGDFAFVIWDQEKQQLFAARSPVGLRRLVYHCDGKRLLIASEARQLLEDPGVSKELDAAWVSMMLVEGRHHWGNTIYRDIQELQPGHSLIADRNGIKVAPFWLPWPRKTLVYRSQQEYTEHFRSLLFDAVHACLDSDHPLVFDLSGGLDSSALCCVAGELHRQSGKENAFHALHVYSSRYQETDDRAYARLVAEKYTIPTHYLSYESYPAFTGLLRARPWFDTPATPLLFLADLYQQYGNMALAFGFHGFVRGDFGDQLMSASPDYLVSLFDEKQILTLLRELWRWQRLTEISMPHALYSSVIKTELSLRKQRRDVEAASAPWLSESVWSTYEQCRGDDSVYLRKVCPAPLARVLYRWMLLRGEYVAMQPDLLASGLETREPFTDLRLIEFLLSCPPQYQLRFGVTKFLLREAMVGMLPEPIRQRRDKGRMRRILCALPAPQHQALRALVVSAPDMVLPYLDIDALARKLDRVALGDAVGHPAFFSALALILWAHRLPWAGGKLSGL